jgi:hypothetical protein
LVKIAAHVGPSAPVHRVTLAIHQAALFLVVYGELHCSKSLAFIHKNAGVNLALTFFMVHGTLLIEKVVSIGFCIFINSIFMLCHLLHIQANQNLRTGNAPATLLSEAVERTLLAHLLPGMSQKNFLVVQLLL